MEKSEDSTVEQLLDQATLAYARELEANLTSHPTAETLIAFQEGRLPAEKAVEIRQHLVVCFQCMEELQRLDTFDETGGPEEEQSPNLKAALGWQRFQERLESQAESRRTTPTGLATARRTSGSWPAWQLAASVVLALLGAFGLFHAFQERDAVVPPIGAHPFLVDLFPDGASAFRDSDLQIVEIPKGVDSLILRLLVGDQTRYNEYSASLATDAGETIWQRPDLQRQPSGEFVLLISRSLVPSGEYVIRLSGERERASTEIASYSFLVREIQ